VQFKGVSGKERDKPWGSVTYNRQEKSLALRLKTFWHEHKF
jgi:hypothetical protein